MQKIITAELFFAFELKSPNNFFNAFRQKFLKKDQYLSGYGRIFNSFQLLPFRSPPVISGSTERKIHWRNISLS